MNNYLKYILTDITREKDLSEIRELTRIRNERNER